MVSLIVTGCDPTCAADPNHAFVFSFPISRNRAMQENESVRFSELSNVLESAHLRRSADLAQWLKHYLRQRREQRSEATPGTTLTANGTVAAS